jgi:anthranilate phosphoribosyltransferase
MLGKKEDLIGGDAVENAKITRGILSGEIKGAKRDAVLLNAAAALLVDEKASSIEEGIELAKEAIDSGKALKHLEKIIEVSQKLGK